jgi:hypothetical protein
VALPVQGLPDPAPVFIAPPAAAPAGEELNLTPQPGLVRTPQRRRSGEGDFPWAKVIGLTLVAGCGIVVGILAITWLGHFRQQGSDGGGPDGAVTGYNCRFKLPPPEWKPDQQAQFSLGVNLALSRQSPSNHFGLFWKDYKDRMPPDGELLDEALRHLRKHLGEAVQWEPKPGEGAHLGGLPAMHIEFAGTDPEQAAVDGECVMLAHRGYGYWLFTWGPDAQHDQLVNEWEKLREGFSLLDGRQTWKEKPREKEVATGARAKYQLSYPTDLWKKQALAGYDPMSDMVLEGFEVDKKAAAHSSKAGLLYVLVLPKEADLKAAAAAVKKHLLKRFQDEGQGNVDLVTVKEKGGAEADREARIGNLAGRLMKWRGSAADSSSFERFYQVGVVQRSAGTLVLLGECHWERRTFWEPEFKLVFDSLKGR